MTIDEILTDIRENAKNTADKGTKFETVILNYFLTEAVYANHIKHAWLWSDFPSSILIDKIFQNAYFLLRFIKLYEEFVKLSFGVTGSRLYRCYSSYITKLG